MLKSLSILLVGLLNAVTMFAVAQPIKCKLLNAATQQPVPYATVSIKGENSGTLSIEDGSFMLDMPGNPDVSSKSITVSSIGYQLLTVKLSDLQKSNPVIYLRPASTVLNIVKVKPTQFKTKVYGRTGNSTFMTATMFTQNQLVDDNLGKEQAAVINIDNDVYLRNFNMYVVFNRFKTVKFRLNIYSVKNGYPDSLLNNSDVIFDVAQKRGWVQVDLTPYNIYLQGHRKIAVAIQWLQSIKDDSTSRAFSVSATLSPTHAVFFRDKTQTAWNKISNAYVAFNITGDYFKPGKTVEVDYAQNKAEQEPALSDSLKNYLAYAKYADEAEASPYGRNAAAGKYMRLNNAAIHYEVYGKGEPLLLLHGNSQSISAFYKQIEAFSKNYQVIAVDTRAQGKSTDSLDHDLTYELFAADMKQLLDTLHLKKANVLGWSDGGITALLMAIKYPGYVNKLAVMGANLSPDGIEAKTINNLQDAYNKEKKFVDRASVNHKRLIKILLTEPHISYGQLKQIKAPVLVLAGEHDVILPRHTQSIHQNIPHSKIYIIKDATHYAPFEKPAEFNQAVLDYFEQ